MRNNQGTEAGNLAIDHIKQNKEDPKQFRNRRNGKKFGDNFIKNFLV